MTSLQKKPLQLRHPDTLYLAVEILFKVSRKQPGTEIIAAAETLAKLIYHTYPNDAPILIAHLSLHNNHFSLSVNEALNCAILTCALGYQQTWSAKVVITLICAALTKDIADLKISNERVDGTRQGSKETKHWRQRGERAAGFLQQAGVTSPLWLDAVKLHASKMDGSGYPNIAGYNLSPAIRLLSWASHFAEQICPRGNRTGLRPRQIIRYSLSKQRLAFDRKFINDTAQMFAPIQPGAVIKTEGGKLAIVIGRQNRHETIITPIDTHELVIEQCNIADIIHRYPLQIEQSRPFLVRLIKGWRQLRTQSISLLDGQLPSREEFTPQQITELSYLFELEEPDVAALAALLTQYPTLLARLAEQAQRVSRRQQAIKQPKQVLMMLGLNRATSLVQRNAMLLALAHHSGPYHHSLTLLIDDYSEIVALLAGETHFAEPETARILATAQCAGLMLCYDLTATKPQWLSAAAEKPSLWFDTADSSRLELMALAFAKRWQLPPFAINALTLAADKIAPDASRKAQGFANLLRLASLFFQGLTQTGTAPTNEPRVIALSQALGIEKTSLDQITKQFIKQYHPFSLLD